MRKIKEERGKVIRDPIHGYIQLSLSETRLMDTWPLQRLHRINQLGLTYLTYPSATHTRFSHSLGVAHLARVIAQKLNLDSDEESMVRLSGLLHDVGHCPLTHSVEEVIGSNEHWISKLLKETELNDILRSEGFSPSRVKKVLDPQNKSVISQILNWGIDADKLDYLVRDSYFTGLGYLSVDVSRIVNSLTCVDENITFDGHRLYELENLLMARYMLYEQVYFHRTVRITDLISLRILRALRELFDFLDLRTSEHFLRTDDACVITELWKYLNDRKTPLSIRELIGALLHRRLPKCVYESELREFEPFTRRRAFEYVNFREELEQEIAHKLNIEPELIFVDLPRFTPSEEGIFVATPEKLSEISEVSQVFQSISRSFRTFCRVYAPPEYRMEAARASKEALKS